MSCSVPGCARPPAHQQEVRATTADALRHLNPEPTGRALTELCEQHRAEFEKLGWLAPRVEEDEDGDGG